MIAKYTFNIGSLYLPFYQFSLGFHLLPRLDPKSVKSKINPFFSSLQMLMRGVEKWWQTPPPPGPISWLLNGSHSVLVYLGRSSHPPPRLWKQNSETACIPRNSFFFLTTVKLVKCDWENRIIIWENKWCLIPKSLPTQKGIPDEPKIKVQNITP